MLNAYEQRLMAFYLANAAAALHHRDREAADLADWIADRENRVAFGGRRRPSLMGAGKRGRDEGMSGGRWRALGEALREEYSAARKARPDRTGQRLRRLARTTGLSRTDVDLLELVLRYQTQPVIESMIDDVFRSSRRFTPLNVQNPALPALLGVSANTVQGRLRGDAPLVRSGLVCIDTDGDLKALERLNRLAAAAPAGAETDVHRLLLDAAPASELDWSDFDHVARDRDHVERVIAGALASGAPGVNILLYGPPGTGKTEFCKVLAERLGVSLYSVGESDDGGDEPVRGERLQELQARPAPARRARRLAPPLRRDGGPSLGPVPRVGALRAVLAHGPAQHGLQGVHAPAPRGGADPDPLDHEQPPRGERDHPSADDVRARASPTDAAGQGPDLDAGARAPRHRGPGGGCVRARAGVRSHPRGGGRGDGGGRARGRGHRRGAPRGPEPVAGARVRAARRRARRRGSISASSRPIPTRSPSPRIS